MITGIDPGMTGAIALLSNKKTFLVVEDMPVMRAGKTSKVNAKELSSLLQDFMFRADCEGEDLYAYLEKVHAMPGQGVTSMFNFGKGVGVIEGVLGSLGIPYEEISPPTWKKRAGLIGQHKDMSRTKAQQMFPSASLVRKKDIGRADALLIARYGGST